MPITPKEDTRLRCSKPAKSLAERRCAQSVFTAMPLDVEVDTRDLGGGAKNWEWIKKGVPLRIEIGPRDLEKGTVAVAAATGVRRKRHLSPSASLSRALRRSLQSIQEALFAKALAFRDEHTRTIDTKDEFYAFFTPKNPDKPEIHGGFALTHWDGSTTVEEQIKTDLKVTIRCLPADGLGREPGVCPFTGNPSPRRVIWAKSY